MLFLGVFVFLLYRCFFVVIYLGFAFYSLFLEVFLVWLCCFLGGCWFWVCFWYVCVMCEGLYRVVLYCVYRSNMSVCGHIVVV